MKKTIKEIMIEFKQNMFWGLDKVQVPDKSKVNDFISMYAIPDDIKNLLSITDGFVLFNAGDYMIYDIDRILDFRDKYGTDYINEALDIGYFMGYELLINQNESHTQNYLYVGDACSLDQYVCVGSLTDFLNGFIDVRGEYFPFWEVDEKKYVSFER